MFVRFKHTLARIPACPKPSYDTGCTYCQPSEELLSTVKSVPEDISQTIPPLNRVIMYRSGNKDFNTWPKKVEAIDPMARLSKHGRGNGNMIIMSTFAGGDLLVWPDAKQIKFDINNNDSVEEFFQTVNAGEPVQETEKIKTKPVVKPTIVICGHTQRDPRCGIIGKLIHDEFEKVLAKEGVEADLGIVSHIGGHVYAGNVGIFKPDGNVIWYGMVRPHHVQGIVEKTVVGNVIIQELSRQ